MKRFIAFVVVMVYAFLPSTAPAQEHWTEGPVRQVSLYRTKPGKFDDYMKYLRANFLPPQEEAKKQGLIVDFQVMVKTPQNREDWDVGIVIIHQNFGKALDFNQGDADKMKAIAAKHYGTPDEEKQRDVAAKRLDMRDYVGTNYIRVVNLRPMK
jgi:hypothetical protein